MQKSCVYQQLKFVTDRQTDRQTDRRKSDLNSGAYYVTLAKKTHRTQNTQVKKLSNQGRRQTFSLESAKTTSSFSLSIPPLSLPFALNLQNTARRSRERYQPPQPVLTQPAHASSDNNFDGLLSQLF